MSVVHRPVLYGYYRSSCTWRVRTALNWKNINYDTHVVNLQSKDYLNNTEFLSVSPNKKVPVLVHNGNSISESLAIIEYLDEQFPSCPFLPKDPVKRAQARAIALQITAGIQPLQNKRVVNYVQEQQKTGAELQEAAGGGPLTFIVPAFDPEKNERIRQTWCKYWVNNGLVDLEAMVQKTAGIYAVGNEVTTADFCIPSIMDKARGYKVDMSKFPILNRIDEELAKLEPFQRAEARNQPDSQK